MRRPSPGTVIALLALFVALGGPAEARRLLSGKSIKTGSLTGKQVKNRSLSIIDLSRGTVRRLTANRAGSVGTAAIADRAVTGQKLAPFAVGSVELADAAVNGSKLARGAVGSEQVGDDSLQGSDLAAGSVGGDEVDDGRLTARDVASFVGTVTIDFGPVNVDECGFADKDVTAVAATTPPRSVADDAVVVTPPAQFPDDTMVLSAAPVSATKIRVRVCNAFGSGQVDLPSLTFRYISFDF